jgi:hypothetical protein
MKQKFQLPVFVTGGSGFVGSNLIATLCGRGYQVKALVCSKGAAKSVSEAGATLIAGDLNDFKSLVSGIAGCATVFHCAGVLNLEMTADRVCSVKELEASEIWKRGKSRRRVAGRSLLCFWAVRELGMSMTELSRRLELSLSGVSQSVIRGEKIAEIKSFGLLDKKL